MPLVLGFLLAIVLALVVHKLAARPNPLRLMLRLPARKTDDPRVAAAAMLYAVAAECGPVTRETELLIVSQLVSIADLDIAVARTCLRQGRRAARLDGDLTAKLHQLKDPIMRQCSLEERQDVIDMLRTVAGPTGEQVGPVRRAIGRLAATMLHN